MDPKIVDVALTIVALITQPTPQQPLYPPYPIEDLTRISRERNCVYPTPGQPKGNATKPKPRL